jgi:hypothetical protein
MIVVVGQTFSLSTVTFNVAVTGSTLSQLLRARLTNGNRRNSRPPDGADMVGEHKPIYQN